MAPPSDEIDPELISLKRKRAGIGPVLAASVILVCGYVMVTLRADFGYALTAEKPLDFGDARAAYAAGKTVPDNRHLTVTLRPDMAHPGWLRGREAVGYRVMPALGTSGRLWLQISDDTHAGDAVYDLAYTGRTRKLAELAFHDELATFHESQAAQPRYIDAAALAAGKPDHDVHGDALALVPETPIELDERVAGVALVTVYNTDTIKAEADARAALVAAGFAPAAGAVTTPRSWTFEVPAPEGLAGVRAAISRANLYAAMASDSVNEKVVRHAGDWKDVSVDVAGKQVKLTDGGSFPLDSVASLIAYVKPRVPADAEILLAEQKPSDFWYVLPLYGLLTLVLLLMIWALVRALRSDGPTALPLSFAPPQMSSDTIEPGP